MQRTERKRDKDSPNQDGRKGRSSCSRICARRSLTGSLPVTAKGRRRLDHVAGKGNQPGPFSDVHPAAVPIRIDASTTLGAVASRSAG